ncbi:MAG TPA: hypothetical protein VMT11_03030 [Myxococcaceae bacterium]|nr:hypothetical protein [Myxococcaceae bacterium]
MNAPPQRSLTPAVTLLSAATTAYEILLVRLFGVEQFHHFASMAIGVALLGLGASGTLGALWPPVDSRAADRRLRAGATATALALIVAPWMSHRLNVEPTQLPFEGGQWVRLAGLVALLSVPFFAGGLATLTSLLLAPGRTGRLYGASFAGGALGVALALLVLFVLPPARSLVLPPLLAGLGAMALGWRSPSGAVAAVAGLLAAWLFLGPSWDLQLTPYKSLPQLSALPGARRVAERFSPLGWVLAVDAPSFHMAPGLSLAFRGSFPRQTALLVDGDLVGAATDLTDPGAEELARALPTSVPHALAARLRVLLVGVGDGLALEAALASDAEQVVTLEPNPDLLRLARELGRFEFWQQQRLDDRVGQARAVLAREGGPFDLISLAPGAGHGASVGGVRALEEDFLHTVDAYALFLSHLGPEGILSVTTWLSTPPRESVRTVLSVAAALRRLGHPPSLRLVVLRSWGTVTVLARPAAFSAGEMKRVRALGRERQLDLEWPVDASSPEPPFNVLDDVSIRQAAAAATRSPEEAVRFAAEYPFEVAPVDDARPYPHHFVRLKSLPALVRGAGGAWLPFAEWGPIAVLATLVQTVLLAVLLLLVPVAVWGRRAGGHAPLWAVLGYFGALGFGYLAAEIAAIQQLGLLLGHPVYAVAAVLVIFLALSGLGSAWSDRLRPSRAGQACVALAVLLGMLAVALLGVVHLLQPAAGLLRVLAVLICLGPPAFLMGTPFALGLRQLAPEGGALAWAWASNGFASVVAAPLSALLALELGSRVLLCAAAAGYALAAGVLSVARRVRGSPASSLRGPLTSAYGTE